MYKNIIEIVYKANNIFVIAEFFLAMQGCNDDALHSGMQSRFCSFRGVLKNKAIPGRQP